MAIRRRAKSTRIAFTLLEALVVCAILGLLVTLTAPLAKRVRAASRATRCLANLHEAGNVVQSYIAAHGRTAMGVVDVDYYWDHGPQRGWDIEMGRWAGVIGGPRSVWRCPEGLTAYVGNLRALGRDGRYATPPGGARPVNSSRWREPARLVVAYDLQTDIIDQFMPQAREPYIGDLSDERIRGWLPPDETVHWFGAESLGPHGDKYGVVFADGHAEMGVYRQTAMLWLGPPWWW